MMPGLEQAQHAVKVKKTQGKKKQKCHHGDLSQQSQAEMSEGGMFRIPFTATRVQETLAEHQQRVDQEDLELELTFWSCTHFKLLDTVVVSPFLKCKSSAAESLQSLGSSLISFSLEMWNLVALQSCCGQCSSKWPTRS